jgi:hypothetical protein
MVKLYLQFGKIALEKTKALFDGLPLYIILSRVVGTFRQTAGGSSATL